MTCTDERPDLKVDPRKFRGAKWLVRTNRALVHAGFVVAKTAPRPAIQAIVALLGPECRVGCEVGVLRAHNARSIMRHVRPQRLYLVDPYAPYSESALYGDLGVVQREAWCRMSPWAPAIRWVQTDGSARAASRVPADLDFVYIDGDHRFEAVQLDLALYGPKVRAGGILGGHDFFDHEGVNRAVVQYCAAAGLQLFTAQNDWWVMR